MATASYVLGDTVAYIDIGDYVKLYLKVWYYFYLCINVYMPCVCGYLWKPEEGTGSFGAGFKGFCAPLLYMSSRSFMSKLLES